MNSSARAPAYFFDTDCLPERDRFPVFFEEIVRRWTGIELETADQLGFRAKASLQQFGSIGIARHFNSALGTARTPELIRDGDDGLRVVLLESGSAYQLQSDVDEGVAPGDGVVCDCAYAGQYNFTAASRSWSLKIPRRRLAALLPGASRLAGMKLNGNDAARRLLFGYLQAVFGTDLQERGAAGLVEDHIVDLVALAVGAEGETRILAEDRGGRAARRAAILREIDRRSGDPGLSAAAIALQLGITPRYVHLVLEETGKTFTHHVLERRLQRAAALLRDTARRQQRISDVAAEAGFFDLSYFNRAFRRHFGATPSDIRYASGRVVESE